MKFTLRVILLAFFATLSSLSYAQVDTTWLYFKYLQSGGGKVDPAAGGAGHTIDIRLANPSGNTSYYLEENKTFSFRKAGGVPTNTYFGMAGFNSIAYKEGNLRRIANGQNTHELNYRLQFPKNYNDTPPYPGGYPMIVMIHGFGERGNCWGSSCYWQNTNWNPNTNTLNQRSIISVEKEFPANPTSQAVFTTSADHNFPDNTSVIIYNSSNTVYNYAGTARTLRTIAGQPRKFKITGINFSTDATATIVRLIGDTFYITSVVDDGSGNALFTTSTPHGFQNGNSVIVATTLASTYSGTRTVGSATAFTFKLNGRAFTGNATGDTYKSGILNLLNNDHSMTHGGRVHQDAINLVPNGMTPDDPNMPDRAFPGFMFYPQNLNGWGTGSLANNNTYDAIRIIRLLIKKYNIDPNRIYIHGLSDGGAGAYKIMRSAPWLFAAALPMSAVDNADVDNYNMYQYVASVPFWIFQGGVDGNPKPSDTQADVNLYKANGLNVRYTLYPTLGHGTWNAAYAESDFFTWIRNNNKSNIQVLFGKPEVCGTSGAGATMVLGQGFLAYQWEKDGVLIPGENTHQYTALFPGTYRARFSRKLNPTESDWNRWSDPIIVTEKAPEKPILVASGTTVFPSINAGPYSVTLRAKEKKNKYYWYRNGALIIGLWTPYPTPRFSNVQDTLSTIYRGSGAADMGSITLITTEVGGCQSIASDPVVLTNNSPATIITPSNFVGITQSASSIFLTWTDNSLNENGFEVWRRKAGETIFQFVTRTGEDVVSYLDAGLAAGTTYQYKLRAVSNIARSTHAPSDVLTNNLVVATTGDVTPPTPPQNPTVIFNGIDRITLQWQAGTDENGIQQYVIQYGGSSVATNSSQTTYTITGLAINTAYPITIKAQDFSGNQSPPSNQIIGTTYVDGLYYEHSTGAWSSLNPPTSATNGDTPPINWTTYEFTGKMPTPLVNGNPFNVTPAIDDPRGIATQQDFYKIKFDGYLNVPQTKTYQFRTTSDDGSMVFIDGFDPLDLTVNRVVNNDLIGNKTAVSGNVPLNAGAHRIVVLYFEFTGTNTLTVQYRISNGSGGWSPNWTNIPPSLLTTGIYMPPTPPAAPNTLAASATGMTSIGLTWAYGGAPADEFEVYRSLTTNGTYSVVGRGTGLAFSDATVQPGITYYYKLKTVNANGTSGFSNTANATTNTDTAAPTVPAGLALDSKTFTNVAFHWAAATDNVAVAGYEILINGIVSNTTTFTSYMATNLAPGTLYNFTVKAYDASGNKSAESGVLAVTTNAGSMYFSKAGGALNVNTNWGTAADGSGTAPIFTNNGQIYTVANRVSTGLGGALTISGSISKIIVPAGTTLDVDNTISAKIEVQGDGVVNLNNSTAPEFVSVSPTSTINFNTYSTIPVGTYGNVILSGTGNKNFAAGQTTIMSTLTAAAGIALKGAPTNASHVTIGGDITLTGAPAVVAADNALDLTLTKSGAQTITLGGTLDLFRITTGAATNVSFVNGGSAVTINVGSENGGGLSIATGSSLNLGTNHLVMKDAATINAGTETGTLAINGGNMNLTSESSQHSNLYLDVTNKTAGLVTTNFMSTGKLNIKSDLSITDGLKIKAGEFNSGGFVSLLSDVNKTAYLQEIEGNGSVTGTMKVQRWVSALRKYRYMSSVVANMKIASWQPYMPITGNFTGANTNATAASMFYYLENAGATGDYKPYPAPLSNNQVEFGKGVGYSIFNFNGAAPLTLQMTGVPYQGNVVYTLTPGTGGNNGWNLIGNPYASAIRWSNDATEWTKTNVGQVVSVPDNTSGSLVYKTYDAGSNSGTLTGGIIAPGQAFWVQASAAGPTLTVKEKAKRTNNSWLYREGDAPEVITMILSNGTAQDHAYVILGSDYSDTYQPATDGMKFKNTFVNLSTRSTDQINLVFNKLEDSFCEKIVPVTIEDAAPGNYSFSFANVSNLVGVGEVTLTDNFTSVTTTLNDSDAYNFTITAAAASTGTGRFKLTLKRPALEKNAITSIENLCGGTGATVQLTNTQAGVFYYATKADGTTAITEEAMGTGGTLSLQIPVGSLTVGSNSIDIHTGFKGCSNELLMANPIGFTYTPAPTVKVDESYYSICQGAPITIRAESGEGNIFNWYRNGQLIAGQHLPTLTTDLIKSNTTYEVAAVTPNGCEGIKSLISVEVENVPAPFINFDGQALTLTEPVANTVFVQWYRDQEPLEQFEQFLQPQEEGSYTVLVSFNGCSKISDAFTYAVTGLEPEPDANTTFAAYVYPNPATSENLYIKLETPSTQDAEVVMTDLTGRKAFSTVVSGHKVNGVHKINFPQDTPLGMYILTIKQGDILVQRKVIVTFR
jgi:fibronectin type 3 domain-containing protein/predicted esterase